MKAYSAWEYLCIDVANNHFSGLDKKTFETRIDWVQSHISTLEDEAHGEETWKERPLYIKAVSALRKAQRGEPTGHLVGFDAVCSGMQIMSALTGCRNGARATGLVDQDRRADAYTDCTNLMSQILGKTITGARKKVKAAVMTSLYGSKAEPKKEFGEGTDELNAFYEAMMQLCPGPVKLLDSLLKSWNAYSLTHHWQLPDGYDAVVKVMEPNETRIEVEELDRMSFTYMFFENKGKKRDVKNAANVIHSIDAYVLRSLVRRCNYDRDAFEAASDAITTELLLRNLGDKQRRGEPSADGLYYQQLWEESQMADVVAVPHLVESDLTALPTLYLKALLININSMLRHQPFEVVTIHDDFKCHPNNLTHLRRHYTDILAEISRSTTLDFILSQLYGTRMQWQQSDPDLWITIKDANYALC